MEKFVKISLYEGSLMVCHPFNIKARGAYFDKEHNVDREKNKELAWHKKGIRDFEDVKNISFQNSAFMGTNQ